jgi:hypothetical protein
MNGGSTLDDSAHGSASEPLLAHSQNPKADGDAVGTRFSLRLWKSIHDYFAAKKPNPEYMLFLALVFGITCGVVAFVYDTYFEAILTLVWEVKPILTVLLSLQHCFLSSRASVRSVVVPFTWFYLNSAETLINMDLACLL